MIPMGPIRIFGVLGREDTANISEEDCFEEYNYQAIDAPHSARD